MQELIRLGKIDQTSKILDYGCGPGDDMHHLRKLGYQVLGYDPHYLVGKTPFKFRYNTILITYVFCVVDNNTRDAILDKARRHPRKNEKICVSVRRDTKKDYISKAGTHQYAVHLDFPVIAENSSFYIYEI